VNADGGRKEMRRKGKGLKLCEQLREAIEDSGFTVYHIAKAAGVKHAVVARFLSGERDVRLETASKIADALGLELRPPSWSEEKR
jgi:transcriptional regulator with XRE-family HTH domain